MGVTVLYEDPHLIVVNKAAPLLTQAPPGVPSLEADVKAYIKEKYAKPAGVYLGVPHRLDRPVSGVICFCRNTKAAQRVHAQFEQHTVRKTYWAVVGGAVTPDAGAWDDWMKKVPDEARAVRAVEGEVGAKLASLTYRVIAAFPPLPRFGGEGGGEGEFAGTFSRSPLTLTLSPEAGERGLVADDSPVAGASVVELNPVTGRMHQLRAQSAWRGHPVWGDELYGSTVVFGPPAELPRDRVVALHARRLEFDHPFGKGRLVIDADPPSYWPKFTSPPA